MANYRTVTPPRVVDLKAGVQLLKIENRSANMLMISNHGGVEILVGTDTNVQEYPWQRVGPSPSTGMIILQGPGVPPYVYVPSAVQVTIVEYDASDVSMVMAFQVVAKIAETISADITDRASRILGKVTIDGATIQAGNLYTQLRAQPDDGSPADSVVLAGTNDGLAPAAAGANVSWVRIVGNKLWVSIQEWAAGVVMDIADRAGRDLGKVRLMTNAGTLVGPANRLPVEAPGWETVKVTAAGAETVQVKASPGQVALILPVAGVGVTLRDDATEVWPEITAERDFGAHPVQCDTSIDLAFAGAGEAWVIFR